MKTSVNGMTDADLFRLITTFTAIRNLEVRAEFLQAIEAWAQDQWMEK